MQLIRLVTTVMTVILGGHLLTACDGNVSPKSSGGGVGTNGTISETAPGAPTAVSGIAGDSQVELTWSAPANNGAAWITDYLVQYSSNGGSDWVTYDDGISTSTKVTVLGLANGTTYLFRVAATNFAGTGSYSVASDSVRVSALPDAPALVSGTAGDSQVVITWTAPSSDGGALISNYVVQYSSDDGFNWEIFSRAASDVTSATVKGLKNGTRYVFRVAATNSTGTGSYSSNSASVMPVTTPGAPTSVEGIVGNTRVSLTWTAPSSDGGVSISDYVVQYSSDNGSNWTMFSEGAFTSTRATVTGLRNGITYVFKVAARNSAGTGSYSSDSASLTPDEKLLLGGRFNIADKNLVLVSGATRLNNDGTLDSGFSIGTGFNGKVNSIAVQSDGKIVVGGEFTSYNGNTRYRIARLNNDGTIDSGFHIGTGFDGSVYSIAVQSDGKIVVGGKFSAYGGSAQYCVVRLNSDGTLDNGFSKGGGFNGEVHSIAIQSDGKIVFGGNFSVYRESNFMYSGNSGSNAHYVARLNSNGTLDSGFSAAYLFNAKVFSVAVQSDGKIVVGGLFSNRNCIARLNSDGSLDSGFSSMVATYPYVRSILVQSDGKIVVGGEFGIARLNNDGTTDGGFRSGTGFDGSVYSIANQSNGKIVVGGEFTSYNGNTRYRIARLNNDGSIDSGFSIGRGFNDTVYSIGVQSDGKTLVAGNFTSYGTARDGIARLNSDGTLDSGFSIGTGFDGRANSIAVQSDGKIVVGGEFLNYNGTARSRITRLNSNGTLDSGFITGRLGFGNTVRSIAVQSDGKILVGGDFTWYNEHFRSGILRLNSDGTLDTGFGIGTGFDGDVYRVVIQSDGKILVGGIFSNYNGSTRGRIARLNSDGTLDGEFSVGTGFDGKVNSIVVQGDGKIVVGGEFSEYNGTASKRIARLNSDGTLDGGFSIGTGFNNIVQAISIQSNGKIVIAGNFTSYNGDIRSRILRLNSDGTLDGGFSIGTGFNDCVSSIAIQSNGQIVVGGNFKSYNGIEKNYSARLNSDGTLDTSYDFDANNEISAIAL